MNKNNFYNSTFAVWSESSEPERSPDYISKSGSKYWYTSLGVYRKSDHWGCYVASCHWLIKYEGYYNLEVYENEIIAFCKWSDFKSLKSELHDYKPEWSKFVRNFDPKTFEIAFIVLKHVARLHSNIINLEDEIRYLIKHQIK